MGRSGLRGVLVGALTLVVLQVLVTAPNAGRVAELFRVPGQIAVRFLDPTVPAIPDRTPDDKETGGAGGVIGSGAGGLRAGGLGSVSAGASAGATGPQRRYPDPFRVPVDTSTSGGD